jgi:hypothetical protein
VPLFRRRKYPLGPTTIEIDPTLGDPTLRNLLNALVARQWPNAKAILTAAQDFDDLSEMVIVAHDAPGLAEWLPDIVRVELESMHAQLLYGSALIAWAWAARTKYRASYVSQDQFALFFDRLRMAEDCLQGVIRRDPGNASAWHLLIITARGLQRDLAEARARFDRAVAVEPGHLQAHKQMLQNLCQKWHGSHEQMHAFARESAMGAPEGSPLGQLVAIALLEEALGSDGDIRKHMRQRSVVTALTEAAERSVHHPAYATTRYQSEGRNVFAMAFALAGQYKAAAEQFQRIGDAVTGFPWIYLADPGKAFCALRNESYAKA